MPSNTRVEPPRTDSGARRGRKLSARAGAAPQMRPTGGSNALLGLRTKYDIIWVRVRVDDPFQVTRQRCRGNRFARKPLMLVSLGCGA